MVHCMGAFEIEPGIATAHGACADGIVEQDDRLRAFLLAAAAGES